MSRPAGSLGPVRSDRVLGRSGILGMIPITSSQSHIWALAVWTAGVAGCASAAVREDPPSPVHRPPPTPRQERDELDLASLRAQVVESHNRIRAAAKLPALETSERLQAAAQAHARDMATRRKMAHQGS